MTSSRQTAIGAESLICDAHEPVQGQAYGAPASRRQVLWRAGRPRLPV